MENVEPGFIQQRMLEDARNYVRNSGQFQTAQVLAKIYSLDLDDFQARLESWKSRGEIFSIEDGDSGELFPVFAFDQTRGPRPHEAMSQIFDFLANIGSNPNYQLRKPGLEPSRTIQQGIPNPSDVAAADSDRASDSASTTAHPWLTTVFRAAATKPPRRSLEQVVKAGGPQALLACFGISLISSPTYTGEPVRNCDLPGVLKMVGESLADDMEAQDLGTIGADEALKVYVRAIERRSVSQRLLLIKWILELDLFIRTNVKLRDPIPSRSYLGLLKTALWTRNSSPMRSTWRFSAGSTNAGMLATARVAEG
jgi:hypothetical protein